jgi:hypothetical protein
MFTRNDSNRFLSRVLAGLTVSVAMVVAALTHAVVNSQSFV